MSDNILDEAMARLEAAGFRAVTVDEFLGLTPGESAQVDKKMADAFSEVGQDREECDVEYAMPAQAEIRLAEIWDTPEEDAAWAHL